MPKIGLVVEGGGTKAAYSAGVLKCFLEHHIQVNYAVGISAGCEILTGYVSGNPHRLEVTGIEAPCQKGVVGLRPFFKEGSFYGLEATTQFLNQEAPLDLDKLHQSPIEFEVGLYDFKTKSAIYVDKSKLDESHDLIKASCALLLLAHPYEFQGKKVMDAGLVDMISIERALSKGCDKVIVLSTKEVGYRRKPAPGWQLALAKMVYKDKTIVNQFRQRHLAYQKQWDLVDQLEKEGRALVLRPHQDMGISRYTTDPKKLHPWFELGYQETLERLDQIRQFIAK